MHETKLCLTQNCFCTRNSSDDEDMSPVKGFDTDDYFTAGPSGRKRKTNGSSGASKRGKGVNYSDTDNNDMFEMRPPTRRKR